MLYHIDQGTASAVSLLLLVEGLGCGKPAWLHSRGFVKEGALAGNSFSLPQHNHWHVQLCPKLWALAQWPACQTVKVVLLQVV